MKQVRVWWIAVGLLLGLQLQARTRSSIGKPFRILNNVNRKLASSVQLNVKVRQGGEMLQQFMLDWQDFVEVNVDPEYVAFVEIAFGNGGNQMFKLVPDEDTTIMSVVVTGVSARTVDTGKRYWYTINVAPIKKKLFAITTLDTNLTQSQIQRQYGGTTGKPAIK